MIRTVPSLLQARALRWPDQICVEVDQGGTLTFQELEGRAHRVACGLVAQGLQHGARVALGFRNPDALAYFVAYLGIQKAGGVVVPVNPRAPERERTRIIENCEASHQILSLGSYQELVASTAEVTLPIVDAEDLAEIIYTSGTTGLSKGVAVTHANAVGMVDAGAVERAAGHTFLCPVPMTTYAGNAFLLGCLKSGMRNLIMRKFEPLRFVELLQRSDVRSVYGVAPMWLRTLKDCLSDTAPDCPNLRLISFGAAAMPAWAVQRLGELFPHCIIRNMYGLTEAGSAVCMLRPGDHLKRPGSVGRPVPPAEVRIVDGEVCLRLRGVPGRRYFRDEAASQEVFDDEGWVRTGDLGRLDEDGYLYLVDRKKDIVISGGNNVSSAEVESVLLAHPDVAEVAVIGLPDEIYGERVTAVVVGRTGGQPIAAASLQAFAAERLAAFKVPRELRFVSELPRNDMGKVIKNVLRGGL